jgi:hypothetical protein
MKIKNYFLVIFLCIYINFNAQNVGINNSGAVPAASAMLDIVSADKGLLVPRLALATTTDVVTVPSPATSLIVYNTTAASTGTNAVFPGFYYWDGAKWVAFSGSGSKDWALLGNSGTVAGTNFLGTIDNVDLVFKVNNIQAGRLTSNTNNNSFFGYESGLNNTSTWNSFFGSQAGKANTSGGNNVGVGFGAMRNSTTGSANTFLGNNAGANWVTSIGNTAIGNQALQGLAASTGSCNTAVGFAAGSGYTGTAPSGSANGLSQLSGSYNTYIGYSSSGVSSNTFTNSTAIGAFSQVDGNDVVVLGSISGNNSATANTNVLIGRTSNFAANVPMVFTSSAVQIENSSANRNGLYIRNTGTGGSAGIGSYSQNYIGVYGTTQNSFGMYGGVIGTPTGNAYGVGGTTSVNGSGVPVVTTPGGNTGVAGSSNGTGYGVYSYNNSATGWSLYCAGAGDAGKAAGTAWIVSDERLKVEIMPIENVLDKVLAMKPVTYKFKKEYNISEGLKIGFLSQDVQRIFPTLVKEKILPTPYETSADGTKVRLSDEQTPETALYMDMESMTPILFRAIQEQQKQIEELKNEIRILKKDK